MFTVPAGLICYARDMNEHDIITLLQGILNRPVMSHKYSFGHIMVVGGSPGMVGSAWLAGQAAMRAGAGLVTIGTSAEVQAVLDARVRELMTAALPLDNSKAFKVVQDYVENRRVSTLVVGPGLPASRRDLVRDIATNLDLPIVLDAGGLATFERRTEELAEAGSINPNIILTPHPGEYARVTGESLPEDRGGIRDHVALFAHHHHVTLVFKGHETLVASPRSSTIYENVTGNPGLATAGSGDVLSGIIAALSGQGLEPFQAAAAGVYLHGLSADLAVREKTQPGLIASDIIDHLPLAYRTIGAAKLG